MKPPLSQRTCTEESSPPNEGSRPALPDFAYLIKASRESVQRGDLDEATVMLDEARKQASGHPPRQAAATALAQEIEQRLKGREEGILQRLAAVQDCFSASQLMRADRLLYEAIEDCGQDPRFDELRERLKALHLEDLEATLEAMVQRAHELAAEHRDSDALELMQKAQTMAPPQRQALRQRLQATAETLQQLARRHRQERLESAQQEVDHHLAAFDLPAARSAAAAAEGSLGSPETVASLRSHLQWRISQHVHAEVQAADQASEGSLPGRAVTRLRRAMALKPNDSWLQTRLDQALKQQIKFERELQEDPLWQRQTAAIQVAIVEGCFADGRVLLDNAEDRWGQGASLDDLRQRLEQQCQEQLRQTLKTARQAHLDGDRATAEGHLAKAARLAPEDPSVLNLQETLRRPGPTLEDSQASPELTTALTELHQLIADGHSLAAWRKVQAAIESFGEVEPLRILQRRIAQGMVDDV